MITETQAWILYNKLVFLKEPYAEFDGVKWKIRNTFSTISARDNPDYLLYYLSVFNLTSQANKNLLAFPIYIYWNKKFNAPETIKHTAIILEEY